MLRFALASKGELEAPTISFLDACGIRVERHNPRQYTAGVAGQPDILVLFQRAADIADKVNEGSADLGITGFDNVAEYRREGDQIVVVLEDLGFSRCQLVLAVPDAWIDVATVDDLADLAVEFREQGRELRIATKYPRLTSQFFYQKGVHNFSLVESHGAMEVAPAMGYADIIADLTSSGTTLRENRLKLLDGGSILASQACLIANRKALRSDKQKLAITRRLLEFIEAHVRSRRYYSITANIRGESAGAVAAQVLARSEIAGIKGPTISRVYSHTNGDAWFAVTVVVAVGNLMDAVDRMREIGGGSITVSSPRYVFEDHATSYQRLLDTLR